MTAVTCMEQTEKVIYSHQCRNSMIELVTNTNKNAGFISNSTSTGKLYKDAVQHLNSFPFQVHDFWEEFGDE